MAAAVLFWVALGWLSRQDRLTAAGAALAARARRDRSALAASAASWDDPAPRALRQRALAVAAGVPEAVPGAPAARRGRRRRRMRSGARRPDGKQRPTEVWSSFSGSWRLVRIESGERLGMASGFALLGGAAWLGLISYAVSIPGGTGPLPAILAGGAVLTAGLGVRRIIMMAAIPRRASFEAQVIARWHEESESENTSSTVSYIAVDRAAGAGRGRRSSTSAIPRAATSSSGCSGRTMAAAFPRVLRYPIEPTNTLLVGGERRLLGGAAASATPTALPAALRPLAREAAARAGAAAARRRGLHRRPRPGRVAGRQLPAGIRRMS